MIPECLLDLLLGVHHKGSMLYNWLIDGLAGGQQEAHAALTLCGGCHVASIAQNQSLHMKQMLLSPFPGCLALMCAAPQRSKQ